MSGKRQATLGQVLPTGTWSEPDPAPEAAAEPTPAVTPVPADAEAALPPADKEKPTVPTPASLFRRPKRRIVESDDEPELAQKPSLPNPKAAKASDDGPASTPAPARADAPAQGKPKPSPKQAKKKAAGKASKSKSNEAEDDSDSDSPKGSSAGPSSVPYKTLCATFELIQATTKRLEIQSHLTDLFRSVIDLSPQCLIECVYLCINRIGPEYEGKELGVGESLLVKAVANAMGRDVKSIKAELDQVGDLGTVAQSKGHQKTIFSAKPLTVTSVFAALKAISNISGQSRKIDAIQKLLVSCSGSEAKFLIRSLEGKLRIGLAEQTVLMSLAHAAALSDSKIAAMPSEKRAAMMAEAAAKIKQVYSAIPSYDLIIPALLEYGFQHLEDHCHMTPGIPLKPMLAHPTKSLTEVLDRFEGMAFTCEYKYDGERAQIHKLENGTVVIYSRNSENLSGKYPDIIERIPNVPKPGVKSFVLDCEAVAWDVKKQCILPFQVLSTRKRKDVQTTDIQVQVCIFAFDLLFLNGEVGTGLDCAKPLITETLKRRRELMYESLNEIEGQFQFAKSMTSSNVEEIQTFLDDSVVGNCEGLMVKTLEKDSSYEPSKRSRNWLKVKKDYVNGLGDSLDLVVIGGYIGRGKRTGWYGGYLLACYDEDREEYQTICKIGTGFSEDQLAEHAELFKPHVIPGPKPYYKYSDNPNVRPDVWFEPAQVWEVKAADLSISPVHKAATGTIDPNKGISLRFPRFIRVRDDKSPDQATTAAQVAEMYRSQNINPIKGTNMGAADDDFEY
nr:tRNA ligase [Polyrhizophydium stewartii]